MRWCYGLTTRGGVYCRWFDGERGQWYAGGTWERGRGLESLRAQIEEEVPAPQPGESYTLVGVFGVPEVRTLPVAAPR